MVRKQILFISFKHLNVLIPKLEYHTVVLYNKTQIGWYMSTKYLLLVQWHDDNISSSALRIYIYLTGNWMIFVFEKSYMNLTVVRKYAGGAKEQEFRGAGNYLRLAK